MQHTDSPSPPPLNLPRLIYLTVQASRRTYHRKPRPLLRARLAGLVRPNLRHPIFLVGSPRSGTTFLGDCLARIPEVSYHFEPVATKFASQRIYRDFWSFERGRFFYRSVYGDLMRLHLDADLRFAEKTPRNCFLIPFLSRAFPGAVFIHLVRDGRDVALSYSRKPWLQQAYTQSGRLEPGGYALGTMPRFWVEPERVCEFKTTTDIHRCIWAWSRHVAAARQALLAQSPDRSFTLQYEHLVERPREEAERLLDFLGIDAPESRGTFHKSIARMHRNSIGAWRKELSHDALDQIEKEAGALLDEFRYT